eukprot:3154365-Pleurochrysis_carterae.AAC.1
MTEILRINTSAATTEMAALLRNCSSLWDEFRKSTNQPARALYCHLSRFWAFMCSVSIGNDFERQHAKLIVGLGVAAGRQQPALQQIASTHLAKHGHARFAGGPWLACKVVKCK